MAGYLDAAWYLDGSTGMAVTDLGNNGDSAAASYVISITVPAGALIVVAVNEASATAVGSVSDATNGTYTQAVSGSLSSASGFGAIWYFQNSAALNAVTLTITKSAGGSAHASTACAMYITGAATTSVLDTAFTASSAVNTASPTVTSAAAPAGIGELIVGACLTSHSPAAVVTNPATFNAPFGQQTNRPTAVVAGGHINVGGNLPYIYNPTLSVAADNITFIIAFKPPSAQLKGWWNMTPWASGTVTAAGAVVRQNATPVIGNERVFVCTIAGTTGGSEPAWVVTRGAKTTDNTVTWMEMTGVAGLNGDATNTPNWTAAKAGNSSPSLGCLIQRNNGASYWVCTTAGAMGLAEPSWPNDTAGTTQADSGVTWTCLGVVGNWTGWQTPCPRLAVLASGVGWIVSASAIPNDISNKCDVYVASEHAETQATAMSFNNVFGRYSTTTPALNVLCRILCVTKTTVPPVSANLTTGASISTTGNSSINMLTGSHYVQGITISAGSGAVAAVISWQNATSLNGYFKNCTMIKAGTAAGNLAVGNASSILVFDNTTWQFGAVGDNFMLFSSVAAKLIWKNTVSAIQGSIIPTNLIGSNYAGEVLLEALDLSALTTTILQSSGANTIRLVTRNCKLNAGVTVSGVPANPFGSVVDLVRCDSGATNYRHEHYEAGGSQVVETTIVRTGGATDGTTPISWKIVTTTAGPSWGAFPFQSMPMAIWNDTTATNRVVTVYGITAAGGLPNNDDIWIEVEYPGSASTPIGTIATTTKADTFASGVAVASDGSTWGGGVTAFKLVATLSSPQTQMKGPFLIVVKVAKSSTTFYIDPAPVLS
jgi:hypothetical protein